STAEMFTGTSNTGARSLAVFSSSSAGPASASPGPNSSSFRSSSAMSGLGSRVWIGVGVEVRGARQGERLGVQALGGESAFQRLADARGGAGRVEGGRAVA